MRLSILVVVLVSALCPSFVLAQDGTAPAAAPIEQATPPPTVIPLIGQLRTADGSPRVGIVSLKLSLYRAADDPDPIWTEEQLVPLDAQGAYTVYLGATRETGLPARLFVDDGARWVGVAVAGETEQPRTRIIRAPYASKANAADLLSGKRASDFVLSENLEGILKAWGVPVARPTRPTRPGGGDDGSVTIMSGGSSTPNTVVKYLDNAGTMGESAVVETGGYVGMGTTAPQLRLETAGNSWAAASIHMNAATADVSSPVLRLSKSRGTLATPADVQSGDQLGSLAFHARSGALNFGTAEINAIVAAPFTSGQRPPSRLEFITSPANGAGTTRMVIGSNGYVGIGTTAPQLKLEAAGNNWADASLHLNAATPDNTSPVFRLSKSRGTLTVPTDVQSGDQLGSVAFYGRSGGINFGTAEINAVVDDWFASGQRPPSRLEFWTYPAVGAGAPRMVVRSDGNVGIGTAAPWYPLHVHQSTANTAMYIKNSNPSQSYGLLIDTQTTSPNQAALHIRSNIGANNLFVVNNDGHIGVGTSTPGYPLHVLQTTANTSMYIKNSNPSQSYGLLIDTQTANANEAALHIRSSSGANQLLVVNNDGRVGIGTVTPSATLDVVGGARVGGALTVTSDITVNGNINAKYQDVAEWVDAVEPLPAATVVTADRQSANRVRRSTRAYDTAVLGVVSAQPGVLLGEKGEGKIAVAQSGRVKVKVDARYGAIEPGDLLVTSPAAGYAMRSRPLRSGIHRPGTIIGKALESITKGRGEILVLLTLQ